MLDHQRIGTREEMTGLYVSVYRNLHRQCWSVRAEEGPYKGRVMAHMDALNLTGCTFKVSEAGRQRVLREKRKNVHARVMGLFNRSTALDDLDLPTRHWGLEGITYNPYKGPNFVTLDGEPRFESLRVTFGPDGQLVALRRNQN